jgi:hypothetical protein
MVDVREKAIQEAGGGIVRVSRLIGFGVMYMMGYDVDLFGDDAEREVPCKELPEFIPELVGMMGTISMIPDGSMRTHDDHAVNESDGEDPDAEIFEEEDK